MRVKRLTETAKLPTKANPGDLGYDLYADESYMIDWGVGEPYKIHTNIAIEFPTDLGGIIKDRSSMAAKGLQVCGGVIDSGYRGEIIILMRNHWGKHYIGKGEKVAQLILVPTYDFEIEEVTGPLFETVRGGKGFGSSGA